MIIPSKYIDQESRYLCKSSDDDDDDDDENQNYGQNSIIRRSYVPSEMLNKNSLIPYWISLNADDSILALVLSNLIDYSCILIFYNVVRLIQTVSIDAE